MTNAPPRRQKAQGVGMWMDSGASRHCTVVMTGVQESTSCTAPPELDGHDGLPEACHVLFPFEWTSEPLSW